MLKKTFVDNKGKILEVKSAFIYEGSILALILIRLEIWLNFKLKGSVKKDEHEGKR